MYKKLDNYFSEVRLINEYLEYLPSDIHEEIKTRFKRMSSAKKQSDDYDALFTALLNSLSSDLNIVNILNNKISDYKKHLEQRNNQIKDTRYFKSPISLFSRNHILNSELAELKSLIEDIESKTSEISKIQEEHHITNNILSATKAALSPEFSTKKTPRNKKYDNADNILVKIKFRYNEFTGKNEVLAIKDKYDSILESKLMSINSLVESLSKSSQRTHKNAQNLSEVRNKIDIFIYHEDKYFLEMLKRINDKKSIAEDKRSELNLKFMNYCSIPICQRNACNDEATCTCGYCNRVFCKYHSPPLFPTSLSEKASANQDNPYVYQKVQESWNHFDGHPCPDYRGSQTFGSNKPRYRT
ncbi:MAG: hypothetical protein M1354_00695, partial [Candidatus Marsarchaeota archaeon]|nr:hypothetical protein [Candidatus Marsarchaeota archaeon]